MKKLILSLIFCVVAFKVFSLELPESVKDIQTYSKYLSKNFKYKAEPKWRFGEHWQTPEETIQLRRGDCEDMACLTYTVLKQFGYKPTIYILIDTVNHAVLTVRGGRGLILFSNTNAWYSRYTNEIKLLVAYFKPKEIYKLTKIKYGRFVLFNFKTQAVKVWGAE